MRNLWLFYSTWGTFTPDFQHLTRILLVSYGCGRDVFFRLHWQLFFFLSFDLQWIIYCSLSGMLPLIQIQMKWLMLSMWTVMSWRSYWEKLMLAKEVWSCPRGSDSLWTISYSSGGTMLSKGLWDRSLTWKPFTSWNKNQRACSMVWGGSYILIK